MKKYMRWLLPLLAVLLCMELAPVGPGDSTIYAAKKSKTITVSKASIKKNGARKALQTALDEARDKASSRTPYVVKLPKGTYQLDACVFLYSNTTLNLKNVTLKRKNANKNMIRTGDLDTVKTGATGYKYKNIHIVGGTIDGAGKTGTVVKFVHAKDCSVENVRFKNAKNGHMIEMGAIDGMTIRGCSFKKQVIGKNSALCYEAIQLDIAEKTHIADCRAQALASKNVTVENCSFENVPRGVGSHTSVYNLPYENITVKDCSFKNTSSAAIQAVAWKNCTITGNTITGTPKGIEIVTMREAAYATFLPSYLAKEGRTKTSVSSGYKAPVSNLKIVISNNKITLNTKDDPYSSTIPVAIRLCRCRITTREKNTDGSGGVPKGDYYISGVSVTQNTVTTTGFGVRVENGRACRITDNKVTFKNSRKSDASYYPVLITDGSRKVSIMDNTISNGLETAIHVTQSSIQEITDNMINHPGKNGIKAANGSSVESIIGNTIIEPEVYGICISSNTSVQTVKINTIFEAKELAVKVDKTSNVTDLEE